MKKADGIREKQLKAIIDKVVKQNVNLKEQQKVFSKQLDFMQDQVARTAIESQALQQSMSFMMEKANVVLKEEADRDRAGVG